MDGRILVFAIPPDDLVARRSPPYFDFGDIITVTGTLRTPEPFGGFDYPAYLAGQGITEIMSAETAEVVGGLAGGGSGRTRYEGVCRRASKTPFPTPSRLWVRRCF